MFDPRSSLVVCLGSTRDRVWSCVRVRPEIEFGRVFDLRESVVVCSILATVWSCFRLLLEFLKFIVLVWFCYAPLFTFSFLANVSLILVFTPTFLCSSRGTLETI